MTRTVLLVLLFLGYVASTSLPLTKKPVPTKAPVVTKTTKCTPKIYTPKPPPTVRKQCTKANEVLEPCVRSCPPEEACDSVFRPVAVLCARPDPDVPCLPGCRCAEGYVRNKKGNCVKPEQCCDHILNAEVISCPNPGKPTCSDPFAPKQVADCFGQGCACKTNFIWNNNQCIPINQCRKPLCGANEVYSECKSACPDTCESITSTEPQPVCAVAFPCPPGCNCKDGYVRDSSGACVAKEECYKRLVCKKPNEEKVPCAPSCPPETNCQLFLNQIAYKCAAPKDTDPCVPSCRCSKGWVRDNSGVNCIKPERCCDDVPNAEVGECPNPGTPTCSDPFKPKLNIPEECRNGCICKPGYIWADDRDRCILPEECPKPICGANEAYAECRSPCPQTCPSISGVEPLRFCSQDLPCPGGCDCRDGYVRSTTGDCILVKECPAPVICKDNEVLNECPGPCVPGEISYCSEYLADLPQECSPPASLPCQPRCDCASGYLRNSQGICVLKQNCCDDPNATVESCPTNCPRTCDNLGETISCDKSCRVRGCVCKEGYVLSASQDGKCIPVETCPLKCGKEEVLNECPGYCTFDEDCGSYVQGFIRDCAAPPEEPIPCSPRCDCQQGYLRINATCQLPDKCCEDPFAKLVDCPAPCEETCSSKPAAGCKEDCRIRACRCISGYVKKDGKCIPRKTCPAPPKPTVSPKSCSDANKEYLPCGPAIPPSCSNRNPVCKEKCKPGCFCKKGLLLDSNNKCVKPCDCKPY